jgi:hypothetical protein
MKTIIAGSRKFNNREAVFAAVTESGFVITEVVSGTAKGVDRLGEDWAKQNGVPIKQFPADWVKHKRPIGKNPAGMIRNGEMAVYADALIAIWDGESPGTKGMIDLARSRGLQVYVKRVAAPVSAEGLSVRGDFIGQPEKHFTFAKSAIPVCDAPSADAVFANCNVQLLMRDDEDPAPK